MTKYDSSLAVVARLLDASEEALGVQRCMVAAIITHQTTELLLRMLIHRFGRSRGLETTTLTLAAEREMSIRSLLLYFDLIYPGNKLSARLLDVHQQRKSIMHRLVSGCEPLNVPDDQTQAQCLAATELNLELRELLQPDQSRILG